MAAANSAPTEPERETAPDPAPPPTVTGPVVDGAGGLTPETVLLAPGSVPEPPVLIGPAEPVPEGAVTEDDRVDVSSES